jgi:hypothetical protein
MPPEMKAEVPLKLDDGREFIVTMNHTVMFDAEQTSGQPLPRLMAQAKVGFMGSVRTFLFAGLRVRHPDVTLEEASEMTLREFDKVDAALTAAFKLAFPDAAGGKDDKNPPKAPRTGKRSGASGAKPGSIRKPSGKQPRARSA